MVIHTGQVDLQFKVNGIISNCGKCNLSEANLAANEAAVGWIIYGCRSNNRCQSKDSQLSLLLSLVVQLQTQSPQPNL